MAKIDGYKYSRDQILNGAKSYVLQYGFLRLTYGRLGKELGMSDRAIVYYFPTRNDLIHAVVHSFSHDMSSTLDNVFGDTPLTKEEIIRRAKEALSTPEMIQLFRLYFEIIGLSVSQEEPYKPLLQSLSEGWVAWLESKLASSSQRVKREEALEIMAIIDGMYLVDYTLGN